MYSLAKISLTSSLLQSLLDHKSYGLPDWSLVLKAWVLNLRLPFLAGVPSSLCSPGIQVPCQPTSCSFLQPYFYSYLLLPGLLLLWHPQICVQANTSFKFYISPWTLTPDAKTSKRKHICRPPIFCPIGHHSTFLKHTHLWVTVTFSTTTVELQGASAMIDQNL